MAHPPRSGWRPVACPRQQYSAQTPGIQPVYYQIRNTQRQFATGCHITQREYTQIVKQRQHERLGIRLGQQPGHTELVFQ
jgi:hypothetical protein